MLTAADFASSRQILSALLDPVKAEGARLTLSPVLQGPISKGEVQIYYAGSSPGAPLKTTFNSPFKQVRTIRHRVNLVLKNLSDPAAATDLLQGVRGLVSGSYLFGEQEDPALFQGATYPGEDTFTKLGDQGFYFYTLLIQTQVVEVLPMPGSVAPPPSED